MILSILLDYLRIKGNKVVIYCIMDRGDTGTGEHCSPLCCHRLLILFLIFASIGGGGGRCGFICGEGRRQGYLLRDDTLLGLGVSKSEGQLQSEVTSRRERERERERVSVSV